MEGALVGRLGQTGLGSRLAGVCVATGGQPRPTQAAAGGGIWGGADSRSRPAKMHPLQAESALPLLPPDVFSVSAVGSLDRSSPWNLVPEFTTSLL